MTPVAVMLDTDIGSDVDDALALSVLLGRPDVDLVAVTTVYGDTLLRARLASRYAALAGRRLEVHAGLAEPLSGREVWWPGHEGSLHDDLEREPVASTDAVGHLVATAAARPGEVHLIAIGPLTNVAAALDRDPAFATNLAGLWVMGGAFTTDDVEHNFRSDAVAAHRVFTAGIPTVVTGLDVTRLVTVTQQHLDRIAASGALGEALRGDISQWWDYWKVQWNVPHDPVTVLSLTAPHLVTRSAPGRVEITVGGPDDGRSRFVEDPQGTTQVLTDLQADAVSETMITAIEALA